MIRFNCPHCGNAIKARDETAGMQGKCLGCSKIIPIPSAGLSPRSAAPDFVSAEGSQMADGEYAGPPVAAVLGGFGVPLADSSLIEKMLNEDDEAEQKKKKLNRMTRLVECVDCGRSISRRASTCPHCGRPIAEQTQWSAVAEERASLEPIQVLVSTCDIITPYVVIGPVYFQVSNKGVFSSPFGTLVKQYKSLLADMKTRGQLGEARADWGFLYGEWSVGQSDFDKAFYIAVEELKKRATMLGADAIIGLRQDIDIDTIDFGCFYLQMYGTAVRRIREHTDQGHGIGL